jgi:hypothetical protein
MIISYDLNRETMLMEKTIKCYNENEELRARMFSPTQF